LSKAIPSISYIIHINLSKKKKNKKCPQDYFEINKILGKLVSYSRGIIHISITLTNKRKRKIL
jgi:hypothetical protein